MTTLAQLALERFGLRGARLRQLRHGFGRVFHVVSSTREQFCLRMYDLPVDGEHASRPSPPPGRPSLEQLRTQLLWLSTLARETPLLVPELVPAAQRVHEDLQELGHGSETFGPIHRDLHLGNILFHGSRVGVIDFDMCGLGHYLLDLAVLLNALRNQRQDRFWKMREVLFENYEREISLPDGYRRYLMTFHAMRHVARLNRELRVLSSETNRHRASGPHVLRNVLNWMQSSYLKDNRQG